MKHRFEITIDDNVVRLSEFDPDGSICDIKEQDVPGRWLLDLLVKIALGDKFAIRKVKR